MAQHRTQEYADGRTPLYTISRLAELLDVERKTIYRLEIPFVRVGSHRRYRPEDVDAYLEARREEPAP